MSPNPSPSNPFALLMDPDSVVQAMECSDRLSRLHRRICRPLDKPLIPRASKELVDFDRDIDRADDPVLDSGC